MKITLIGAGNVATSLGCALQDAGCQIAMVYSRTENSASRLASLLSVPYTISFSELPADSDIYISVLADDALLQYAPEIVKGREGAIFLHTAGSVSMDIWRLAGAENYGVLYPMQTFSQGKKVDWKSVPVFVEASALNVLQIVSNVANKLSSNVRGLNSEDRCRLHIAAVFACNFANRMMTISASILNEIGVDFNVMMPLVKEMAGKLEVMSPQMAQTGPARRNDRKIMKDHLQILSSNEDWYNMYKTVSDNILKSCGNDRL